MTCLAHVVAQPQRTLDRLGNVWDDAVAPAADLVTEDSETACPSRSDLSLRDDAAGRCGVSTTGRLLDDEPSVRYANLERRVIKVTCVPALQP